MANNTEQNAGDLKWGFSGKQRVLLSYKLSIFSCGHQRLRDWVMFTMGDVYHVRSTWPRDHRRRLYAWATGDNNHQSVVFSLKPFLIRRCLFCSGRFRALLTGCSMQAGDMLITTRTQFKVTAVWYFLCAFSPKIYNICVASLILEHCAFKVLIFFFIFFLFCLFGCRSSSQGIH